MASHVLSSVAGAVIDMQPIRRALLSVNDKTGLLEIAKVLASFNVELLSTGGTAKATAELLSLIGCDVLGFAFIIELKDLGGRKRLPDLPIITLVEY